jgi:hypothetical protein
MPAHGGEMPDMRPGRTQWGWRSLVLAALVMGAAIAAPGGSASAGRFRFYDLDKVPKPKVTGKQIVAGLEDFVDRFPMRQNGMPNNIAASEFLAKEAEKFGFKSKILEFEVASTPPRTVRVVQSIKEGTTKPDEWIAFIAHYDIVPQTIQAAYDDGAGTNMMRYFVRAFSKVKMNRSMVMLWFDAEEVGLLASEAYAEKLEKQGQKIQAGFGFDMVGIGYPARYCICIYNGGQPGVQEIAKPIIDYVNFDHLKWPKGDGGSSLAEKWPLGTKPHICNCGPNIRNSDEQNFAERGWFTMRWTGMRTAFDYPGYHQPWDTVPFMELVAGGRDPLEKGSYNTLLSAYYSAFVLDNLPFLGKPGAL